MRRRVAVAAALAPVLLLAGCFRTSTPTPTPTPTTSGGPVAWSDCYNDAHATNQQLTHQYTVECGTVTVPQDWKNPNNGKTFDIAVMRIYTGNLTDKKGSVLTNPGGPGGSGLTFLPNLVTQLTNLMDTFVMVSFDPRGVGKSDPVNCISDADLDASFAADPDPASQTDFNSEAAVAKRIGDGCGAKYGDQLSLFSTEQAARDMDAIRAAVGDSKLTYLGFSYGTLLGAVYAELFPKNVRAAVLDGAVDPTADPVSSSETQAMGFERALSDFSTWCKSNSSKCPISADPQAAITTQINNARTSPVKGPDGRLATAGWVAWAVTMAMYSQSFWQYLGPAIDDLSRGDAQLIFLLADNYAERDSSGHYSNLFAANDAVNCADANYPSTDQIRTLQAQWRTKYPTFGAMEATGLLSCAEWPSKKDPYPVGPASGAPPIVVVGTTGDPATPYESTQKLADMLGVGHVVTWEGEGHTAYPNTSCIRRAVDDYLIDLIVPADGLRCPAS